MRLDTDIEALRAIGEEVLRLLSLPEDKLAKEAQGGLRYIASIAKYHEEIDNIANGHPVTP